MFLFQQQSRSQQHQILPSATSVYSIPPVQTNSSTARTPNAGKMHWSSTAALILFFLAYALGTSAAVSLCSSSPYLIFQVLKTYQPALNYRSSKFPILSPTCTAKTTKTNTIAATAFVALASSTTTFTVITGTAGTITVTNTITPPGWFPSWLGRSQTVC
jgi:hypothetical protein